MLTLNILCLDDKPNALPSWIADIFENEQNKHDINIKRDLFANKTSDTAFQIKGLLGGSEKITIHFFRHASLDPEQVIVEIKEKFSKMAIDIMLIDNHWGEGIFTTFGRDTILPVALDFMKNPFKTKTPIQMFPKLFIVSEHFQLDQAQSLLIDDLPQYLDHATRIYAIPKKNNEYLRLCVSQAANEKQLILAFHKELQQSYEVEKKQREKINTLKKACAFPAHDVISSHENLPRPLAGSSDAMKIVLQKITMAAGTDLPLLILGATGTGKENAARAVHQESPRKNKPFVAINCATISPELIESELFGYVKGAFTNANCDHDGCFLQANNGTLFLDEIGDASPALQVKLLRVLQESKVRRVGDEAQPKKINVRIIAATNIDLSAAIKNGSFREDLYFRLAFQMIYMPALNDRREDIAKIVDSIMKDNSNFVVKDFIDSKGLYRILKKNKSSNLHKMIMTKLAKEYKTKKDNIDHAFMTVYNDLLDDDEQKKLYEYCDFSFKPLTEEIKLLKYYQDGVIASRQVRRLNRLILENIAPTLINPRFKMLDSKLKRKLMQWNWQGNIRQLENYILNALFQCQSESLMMAYFPDFNSILSTEKDPKTLPVSFDIKGLRSSTLNKHIHNTLVWINNNPEFRLLNNSEIKQALKGSVLEYFKRNEATIKEVADQNEQLQETVSSIAPLLVHCNIWIAL